MTAWIASLWIVALAGISSRVYGHRGRGYAAGKAEPIRTPRSFRWIYHFIQLSTLVAGPGALLLGWPCFLGVHASASWTIAGLGIATAGMVLFVTARRTLGREYSPCYDAFVPLTIVTAGPYATIRHPIYTANLVVLLGLFVATGSLWIALNCCVLFAYYVHSAKAEEHVLRARFPLYERYARRTHMLVPGIL